MAEDQEHSKERKRLICGLDFGTTNSGIAWVESTASILDAIRIIKIWPGPSKGIDEVWKVASRIAYPNENTSMSETHWGYMVTPKHTSYSWFKLLLDTDADVTEFDDPELKHMDRYQGKGLFRLPTGKTAADVTADYLAELYKYFMKELEKRLSKEIVEMTPVEYWVTLPAVWSDAAKDATKKAAIKAGFGSRDMDSIFLIPEPEAAAIAVLRSIDTVDLNKHVKPGNVALVCDCGGGTIDVTTYIIRQLAPKFVFDELVTGLGGKSGSTYIDREFHRWMAQNFGDKFIKGISFDKKGPGSKFMQSFELAKRDFGHSNDPDQTFEISLHIPKQRNSKKYDTAESNVLLTRDDMQSFFDPVISKTIQVIARQVEDVNALEDGHHVDIILLVGGFGDSPELLRKIKNWARRNGGIRVFCPPNPQAAIVKGAVLRGLEDVRPATRRCRRHYGTNCDSPFREGIDPPSDGYIDNWTQTKYCRGRMDWLLRKGEEISEDTFITKEYWQKEYKNGVRKDEVMLYGCNTDTAPERDSDRAVKYLGRIPVDLSKVDIEKLEKKYVKGRWAYKLSYQIEVVPAGKTGVLTFRVRHQERLLGTTELKYDTL